MCFRRARKTLSIIAIGGVLSILAIAAVVAWGGRAGWLPWGGHGRMQPMHDWMHGRGQSPAPAPEPSPGAREVEVVAVDFSFSPGRIEVVREETVNVKLVNEGRLLHDLTIPAAGVSISAQPGNASVASVRVATPGSWEFYCSVPGHKEAGMVGTLVVS